MVNRKLDFLFNHVFLPPQLPYCDDTKNSEKALVEFLESSCLRLRDLDTSDNYQHWSTILRTLRAFAVLHGSNKSLSKNSLMSAFNDVKDGAIILLHVAVQNSGLIIRKIGDEYTVESFEASPPASQVLGAEKSLLWDFPSHAVTVPSALFEESSFQLHLAQFLEQASVELVKIFASVSLKAGSNAFESRDTVTPAVVGQLLMAILEANGQKYPAHLTRKRVHDEVCWGEGAEKPWRRSPAWLVLRVGIQRSLCFLMGDHVGLYYYKFLMSFNLSSIASEICAKGDFQPDRIAFARTKIARRLAKLQRRKQMAKPPLPETVDALFSRLGKDFKTTLRTLNDRLNQDWSQVRSRATKRISALAKRADPNDTVLSLHHSRTGLQCILKEAMSGRRQADVHLEERHRRYFQYPTSAKTELHENFSVSDYLSLADLERTLSSAVREQSLRAKNEDLDLSCVSFQREMQRYQRFASLAYKSDPEQLSLMLITLLELWQAIDSMALMLYPLLAEYEPHFPADLLYPLHVAEASDLQRIHEIEKYLERRRSLAKPSLRSIFSEVHPSSFAVRYFDQSHEMQQLAATIDAADQRARAEKANEWAQKSSKYEATMKQATETSCIFIQDPHDPLRRRHDDRDCLKHILERRGARMRIEAYEAILPSDEIHVKAVVFELLLPKGFAAWRDASWQLIQLGRQSTITGASPRVSLRDYEGLKDYRRPTQSSITLASRTKSFKKTHYAQISFPTTLDQVYLPSGLKYDLFDHESCLWTSVIRRPNFADLCAPSLPSKSVYKSLGRCFHPTFNDRPPLGNEIVANHVNCPKSLMTTEFTTIQELRLGNRTAWVRLLRELASSNLNFGKLEVGILVTELALVVGPPDEQNLLRASHWVFQDPSFCTTLTTQIKKRLESVAANWREGQTVECLLTLLQRTWSLAASNNAKKEAEALLLYVRKVTHGWTRSLRHEICNATSAEIAQKRSQDALLAALLCRKTFNIEATKSNELLEGDKLAVFLECSFILKENLPSKEIGFIGRLPALLRKLYISDLKLVHCLEPQIRHAIHLLNDAVSQAVNSVWADARGQFARTFTSWTFLSDPYDEWVTALTTSVDSSLRQSVHFNIIDGTFHVDGQPLGRLPDEYTKLGSFHQIFGSRIFLTYPSSIPGMSYQFASLFEEHQIHFGFRSGVPFMRVRSSDNRTLELVPATVFLPKGSADAPDLPLPLINDCIHWLDLVSHKIEIRPLASMWRTKLSDWTVNLRTSQAFRRKSLLVDPRSPIFTKIATIIEPFEHRSRMIVLQPPKSNVLLKLPGLELSFQVNSHGLLESRQLRAVIDSDQDAGTLYGIESKLVLRNSIVQEDRSIIVAMGPATIEKHGPHVRIRISHTGFYARFFVNRVLGRLECASEPRLIYFKAYCHAVTAFVLPDPLTGRSGTDEAIHCLQSGNAQPWAPVDEASYEILSKIASLTPQRVYYPQDLKVLQKVIWKDQFLSTVQHDVFRPVVRDIMQQCRILHKFHIGSAEPPADDQGGDEHLLARAQTRANSFRAVQSHQTYPSPRDSTYIARDCIESSRFRNAHESTSLIRSWSNRIQVTQDLPAILQEWPLIQGFKSNFEIYLLADLMNVNIPANWGSLFTLCQRASETRDKFRLMFLFATISFNAQVDMTIIRTLIAVAIVEDFQTLQLPSHLSFAHFRRGQIPNVELLSQLIQPFRTPYPGDERALISVAMHSKQRRILERAQLIHERKSQESCKKLAHHLLAQWPVFEPAISNLRLEDVPLLDLQMAYQTIKPEWERLSANYELSEHLRCVHDFLRVCQAAHPSLVSTVAPSKRDLFRISPPLALSVIQPTLHTLIRKLSTSSPISLSAPLNERSSAKQPVPNRNVITNIGASGMESLPPFDRSLSVTANVPMRAQSGKFAMIKELKRIVQPFADSGDPVRRAYGKDLQNSIGALEDSEAGTYKELIHAAPATFKAGIATSASSYFNAAQSQLESIRTALTQDEPWLEAGGLLPYITPVSLLEMLRPSAHLAYNSFARSCIISYGESITDLQRQLRIQDAALRKDTTQLASENQNSDHRKWQAKDRPDWLLMEIDFNIRIRPDQLEVALSMTSLDSNGPFCLQMNMGLGKSSVIVPMVVAQLADTRSLVRVVVPRPLLLQTAQLLQARLGGLVGRNVKHAPFTRRSPKALNHLKAYQSLHFEMQRKGGMMLTMPEHMLSFQLSGLQELSDGQNEQASFMMEFHEWLMMNCRNILDECDHMLAVKTQLIYPSGAQTTVDGHPDRWKLVQDILKLVKIHVGPLQRDFPRSIEIVNRSRGTFPTIYLLTPQVKDALLQRLTDDIVKGEGGVLPMNGCSHDEVASVGTFLREAQFPKATALKIAELFKGNKDARQRLLLLRGLFIHKILLLGLSKRWNVQYGVDSRRDPIAVPFKAKGIASEQAEFGHPDVSIILTCLSFYYSGLTLPQFREALSHLIKSDDEPVREYDSWINEFPSISDSLRSWNSINLDDETQCTQLWSHLRQQIKVINYFLNHYVFPRHSRVFERKLVSSGWDIATRPTSASVKPPAISKENVRTRFIQVEVPGDQSSPLTVGFSGTNDNKTLLPLNIVQNDLPGLAHTNADVLTYLLQPRNRTYIPAIKINGRKMSEEDFLHQLRKNQIRVLLDAGAQILEMNNMSLAKAWLLIDTEAEAAVFFGEDDRARVIYRDGKSQPLAGSPYLDNLGACVVYLDEAHTRGVDLKMPANAVAALTLGIQQSKDHTVQAAMRLRQLAISQSIIFFAPPEVHQSILNFRGRKSRNVIDSQDVVAWLLEQTCCSIEQLQPLYISQGLEFCRRQLAAQRYPDLSQSEQLKGYLKVIQQEERYSLEDLYRPDQKKNSRPVDAKGFPVIAGYVEKLNAIKQGLSNTGDTLQALTHQEVEQEREVQIEVETVREVQKPLQATPARQQPFHKHVLSFAETGRLVVGSPAYQQAFVALRQTALGRSIPISEHATKSRLFVTQDFTNVVVVEFGKPMDEYSRPVHWILWSTISDTALIISDYEADVLLPVIRDRKPPCTHLITYAAPVTRAMLAFDTLNFYTIPLLPKHWRASTWLVRDLGIFAGRLYFDSRDQSRAVYQALGLAPPTLPPPKSSLTEEDPSPVKLTETMDPWQELPSADSTHDEVAAAAAAEEVGTAKSQAPFCLNPLLFMQEWLAVRRKGQDFSQSMMGQLLRGVRLDEVDIADDDDNANVDEKDVQSRGAQDAGGDSVDDDDDGDADVDEGWDEGVGYESE